MTPEQPDRVDLLPHTPPILGFSLCTVGHRLQHLFKNRREENAVTLDLAYFPTCPLISKQMAKKQSGLEGRTNAKLLNDRV